VLLSGLRRLLIVFAVICAVTAVVSVVLGALAHANLERSLAVGFYAAGAAVLIGSFVFGLRGPVRGEWDAPLGEEVKELPVPRAGLGGVIPRKVRRTTADERTDARRNSIALFGLGIVLILIGSGFDPARHPF
jgi:amino acid transporter